MVECGKTDARQMDNGLQTAGWFIMAVCFSTTWKGPWPGGAGVLDETLNSHGDTDGRTYILRHVSLSQTWSELHFASGCPVSKCHIHPSHPSFDLQD